MPEFIHSQPWGRRKFDVESWLLSLYLGVSPVYWLPAVSPAVVNSLKAALVVVAVWLLFSRLATTGLILFPSGLMGPVAFVTLLFLSIPGFVQASDPFVAIKFVVDVGIYAVFTWCFYSVARQGYNIRVLLVRSLTIITVLTAVVLVSIPIGLSDWPIPSELDPFASFADAGFGSGRSGWSGALAVYLPNALLLLTTRTRQKFVHPHVLFMLVVGILLGSQIVSGGRTGILVSLFMIVAFTFISSVRWMVGAFVAVGVFVAAALVPLEFWVTHFRLDRISSPEMSLTNLNTLSTNRVNNYIMAVELIRERPFRGYGMGQVWMATDLGEVLEIHNLWLRLAVESGIFLPLFFLAMVCSALCKSWQLLALRTPKETEDRIVAFALGLVLLAGIALSLVEPRTLMGTFQKTAVWWAAVGILLGTYAKQKAIDARRRTSPW